MEKPDEKIVKEINAMSHSQLAKLYRFAPSGHLYFDSSKPYNAIFNKRFMEFGGMTAKISKDIGWGR